MLKFLVMAGVVVAVAGCAPTVYNHPGKTQADYNRDMYDCEQLASAKTRNDGFGNNPIITGDNIRDCMVRKYGYTIGAAQTQVRDYKYEVAKSCRRADGKVIEATPSFCAKIGGTKTDEPVDKNSPDYNPFAVQ